MKIRRYKKSDAKQVARIISTTFAKYNNKEGSKKAVKSYIEHYSPKKPINELNKSFIRTPIFYVALKNEKIIGIIRGLKNRIVNLFVLGKFHGKGIGKNLLERFEKESKRLGSTEIKCNASLYATHFYQQNGYIKTTGIRNFKGIKVQPMIKRFKN